MLLNNYMLPQQDLVVSVHTTFENTDISGDTSSTADIDGGIKAKRVNVSFLIPFNKMDQLEAFYAIAHAKNDQGDLVIYDIVEESCNAAKIRQAKFTGNIRVNESATRNAWQIHFSLLEQFSVPEKMDARQANINDSLLGQQLPINTPQGNTFEAMMAIVNETFS